MGDVRVTLDGALLGTIDVQSTGGWDSWQTFSLTDVALANAGEKVLRLEMVGDAVNLDWFELTQTAPASNLIFNTVQEIGRQVASTLDSDGDGTSNIAEFAFGSHSGSNQSQPTLILGFRPRRQLLPDRSRRSRRNP